MDQEEVLPRGFMLQMYLIVFGVDKLPSAHRSTPDHTSGAKEVLRYVAKCSRSWRSSGKNAPNEILYNSETGTMSTWYSI